MPTSTANKAYTQADLDLRLQMYRFHEESAQRAKTDAWTQATWIMGLSGATLGFSMGMHVSSRNTPDATILTLGCMAAGIFLSAYAAWVLNDLAAHIEHHWTRSNSISASRRHLRQYIYQTGKPISSSVTAGKPKVITRLLWFVMALTLGHVMWAVYACAAH